MEDRAKLFLMLAIVAILGGIAIMNHQQFNEEHPYEEHEGVIAGTYVSGGFGSSTYCVIEIDGERYNYYSTCRLFEGDRVLALKRDVDTSVINVRLIK